MKRVSVSRRKPPFSCLRPKCATSNIASQVIPVATAIAINDNRLHRCNSRIQPGAPMCSTRVETNHATSAAGTAAAATATILINVGS